MDAWTGYQPLHTLRHLDSRRLLATVNGGLVESAVALTAEITAHPDVFEAHLARRDAGRTAWHSVDEPNTAAATAVFVAEMHLMITVLLAALRDHVVADHAARLRAYDAIDLASWRAGQAQQLLHHLGDERARAA